MGVRTSFFTFPLIPFAVAFLSPSKMYSIQPLEGDKKATAKGISGNVKNEVLTHQNYKDSLFQELQMRNKMTTIQSENHELFTVEVEKKSVSPFNDKKWITRKENI